MVGLSFPRDVVFDMYLGRWIEVTALDDDLGLRQVDPVTVVWGLPSEQGKALAPPSTVECTLNNQGGHWTTGNPMSDYFDYLQGRNVPTRLGLRVSTDTFNRSVTGGWGTSDTGDAWQSTSAGSGSKAVSSGTGNHTVSTTLSYQLSYLNESYDDCQVAATASWNMNVGGGPIEPLNLVLRYQTSGSLAGQHYLLRISISAAEVLTAAIWHSSSGVLSSTTTIGTLTPGANSLRAKFQVEGQMLRCKVYDAGPANDPDENEPLDWLLSVNDDTHKSGNPGIRTGVGSGNTNIPVTISYDQWVVTLMQHTGELTKLQPTWDLSHRVKKVSVKATDITQRLGRPQRPALSSAPRRYMASNSEFTTVDFWPLDEASTAPIQGLNAAPGGGATALPLRDTSVTPNRGAITWGMTDQALTSVPAFVGLNNGEGLRMLTNVSALTSSASAMLAVRQAPDSTATFVYSFDLTNPNFVIYLTTSGAYQLWALNTGLGTLTQIGDGSFVSDNTGRGDVWGTLGLTLFNNGVGNIGYHLNIDGTTLGTGSWTSGGTYTGLARISVLPETPTSGGQGDTCISSVVVTSTKFSDFIPGTGLSVGARLSNVIKGWPGERAGTRAYRLCAEEGVPFDYWGDLDRGTPRMGPQRPIPLLDQLVECAEADRGLLYGSRYTSAITLRTRLSMCGEDAVATLSYNDGMIAPEFALAADDRPTGNLVRAERINGGFTIVEQTSGPMNTQDPGSDPNAVGKSPVDVKVNMESDRQLTDVAGWYLALGTVPEVRFPRVTVNMRAAGLTSLAARQVASLHPGDRLLIEDIQDADVYVDLDQLVRGGRTVFKTAYQHDITLNTAPYEVYRTLVMNDSDTRWDSGVSFLNSSIAAAPATLSVATTDGQLWVTDSGQFPLDVVIGRNGVGQRMTISGISGASSPQTFTVSNASVNGVSRAWDAGTEVHIYNPFHYG